MNEHDRDSAAPPRVETEPVRILREAAMKCLTPVGLDLLELGWDAQLSVHAVDADEDHYCDVRLTVRIGRFVRTPIEARASGTDAS